MRPIRFFLCAALIGLTIGVAQCAMAESPGYVPGSEFEDAIKVYRPGAEFGCENPDCMCDPCYCNPCECGKDGDSFLGALNDLYRKQQCYDQFGNLVPCDANGNPLFFPEKTTFISTEGGGAFSAEPLAAEPLFVPLGATTNLMINGTPVSVTNNGGRVTFRWRQRMAAPWGSPMNNSGTITNRHGVQYARGYGLFGLRARPLFWRFRR